MASKTLTKHQKARSLYISYDGLMEPLGQSQVFPYLRGLAGEYAITLLSFEKLKDLRDKVRRKQIREQIEGAGIEWIPLTYHKRLSVLATAFDIAHGIIRAAWCGVRGHFQIVHVRSYVAGVIGLALKSILGAKLIFDMRGFWADEKVDGGTWQSGSAVYRVAKWVERKLLERADVVVSLTHAGVVEMKRFSYLRHKETRFEVITTCTDLKLFQPGDQKGRESHREFVLGYVGSVGTFYLFDEVLECFKEVVKQRPDARLLIVNREGHGHIRERLTALDVAPDRIELHAAEYSDVPSFMARMDAGVFFIKPTFSKKASAPTRLGEFLGCGIPCLVNAGVGDMDVIVSTNRVGVVMKDFSPMSRLAAVNELLELCANGEVRRRTEATAYQYFSLEKGIVAYKNMYMDLVSEGMGVRSQIASRV